MAWSDGLRVGLLAACAMALVVFATTPGVGLSPDSVAYIGAARGLLQGLGLATPLPAGQSKALVWFAPLYPTLLAAGGLLGTDPVAVARWLNVALFAATVLLSARIIATDTGSNGAGLIGSAFLLLSFPMLMIHSMALSEPLFVFLTLCALHWLSQFARRGGTAQLVGAAVAVGLAVLCRYAGLFLIGTSMALIISDARKMARDRVRHAVAFAAVSGVFALLWWGRNWVEAGTLMARRRLALHPIGAADLIRGWHTVASWCWADPRPRLLLVALLAIGAGVALRRRVAARVSRRDPAESSNAIGDKSSPVVRTALFFVAGYAVFLVCVISFFDATVPFDDRLLSPPFAWALIAGVCSAYRVLADPRRHAWQHAAVLAVGVWLAGVQALHSIPWLRAVHRDGQGYAAAEWKQSAILARVRELPPTTRIFSNGDDAIYVLTGRLAERVPERLAPSTQHPNDSYAADVARLCQQLIDPPAVLVYFSSLAWRTYLVSPAEIQQHVNLQTLYAAPDGALYTARP